MTDDAKNTQDVVDRIHKLNFGDGGILDLGIGGYSIQNYIENNCYHNLGQVKLCNECDSCIQKAFSISQDYNLTNVSHGSHSLDYIQANNLLCSKEKEKRIDASDWIDYPIIFVMENPSIQYGDLYDQEHKYKYPAKKWYWNVIERAQEGITTFPKYFRQQCYGGLFYSIINTFELKNAYLTNMVKCGIGKKSHKYNKEVALNTGFYNETIIQNCINKYLLEEIDALRLNANQKVIVFAMGERVYSALQKYSIKNIDLYMLPHPASRLSNHNRQYVLFAHILQALIINNVYSDKRLVEIVKKLANQEDDYCLNIINCQNLENTLSGKGFEYSNEYKTNTKRYWLDNTQIIFKYKTPQDEVLEDGQNRVIWIHYSFSAKTYDVWVGRDNTANIPIETDLRKYAFFREVKEILEGKNND